MGSRNSSSSLPSSSAVNNLNPENRIVVPSSCSSSWSAPCGPPQQLLRCSGVWGLMELWDETAKETSSLSHAANKCLKLTLTTLRILSCRAVTFRAPKRCRKFKFESPTRDFPKIAGLISGCPYDKECIILGSTLAPVMYGNYQVKFGPAIKNKLCSPQRL